jgi:hypothetical protein
MPIFHNKLAEVIGQLPLIKEAPPLIYHWHEEGQKLEGVKMGMRNGSLDV